MKTKEALIADAHFEKSSASISPRSTKKSKSQKPYTLFFAGFQMSLCVHLNRCGSLSRQTESSTNWPGLHMAIFWGMDKVVLH